MARPTKDPRQKKIHVAVYITAEERKNFDEVSKLLGIEKQALARAALQAVVALARSGDLVALQVLVTQGLSKAADRVVKSGV